DLRRRDLTVNAIARTPQGQLLDPLNGSADIQARILRHVGDAFAEDPVRILRLARFAARFGDFAVAPETLELCRSMVQAGEADALVPERVWKEVSRGLMAATPSRMLDVLEQSGALARVMPQLQHVSVVASDLDRASAANLPLPGRYALLCRLTPERDELGRRLRVPERAAAGDPARQLAWTGPADAWRKPDRFAAYCGPPQWWRPSTSQPGSAALTRCAALTPAPSPASARATRRASSRRCSGLA